MIITGKNTAKVDLRKRDRDYGCKETCMVFLDAYIKGLLLINCLGRYEVFGAGPLDQTVAFAKRASFSDRDHFNFKVCFFKSVCVDVFDFALLVDHYDNERVSHQIKYLGLLENVRVRRAGFAFRMDYVRFLNRCALLALHSLPCTALPCTISLCAD